MSNQTPHSSASNIAGTITVAIIPIPAYTITFVNTYMAKRREGERENTSAYIPDQQVQTLPEEHVPSAS
jgi:hypothetical protein